MTHRRDVVFAMNPLARLCLLLLTVAFVFPPSAFAVTERSLPQSETRTTRTMDGEWCPACQGTIDGEGVEVLHRGRRVRLHVGGCEGHWNEDPESVFANLRPTGALMDESADVPAPLASRWFWFGTYVLVGLVCGAAAAYLAIDRGQPALAWFFFGLVLNVVAVGAVLLRPRADVSALPQGIPKGMRKVPVTRAPVECSSCGAQNHPSATSCAGCGAALSPTVEAEMGRAF